MVKFGLLSVLSGKIFQDLLSSLDFVVVPAGLTPEEIIPVLLFLAEAFVTCVESVKVLLTVHFD